MEKPLIFKNKRGKQLMGILHLPETQGKPRTRTNSMQGKFPLVMICHGFGSTKSRERLVGLARALEKENIADFRFDFEGCGDSEGDLKTATIKNEISDLDSALRKILKQKSINKRKVVLMGESLGAVIILLYLVQNKFTAKTLVFWAPALNQKELISIWNTKSDLRKWKQQGYFIRKDKKFGINYLKENEKKDYSPLLSRIQVPILIIHGKKDETVPLGFSKKLAKDYKNIKLVVLPRADHKFEDYYSQQKLVENTKNWLKKYLQ